MSLLPRFLRRAAAPSAVPERKAARSAALLDLAPAPPRWSPRNFTALAREGYCANPVVHRCVRLIAEASASMPWRVYDGDEERPDHPLGALLNRPNARQGGQSFREDLHAFLAVAGNAFVEQVSVDGVVRELHVLRPDRVKVVPGPDGWPIAYDYGFGEDTQRLSQLTPTPSVLHLTLFNPVDDHYGLAPIEAAARAVDVHNAASAWNKALLDNAARPSGALVYSGGDGTLTDAQFERLKEELENGFSGVANAGKPLLLEGGLTWQALSLSPRDMDFLEAKHSAAREIALAFGVPPMLLGIPGDNTFANFQEANRSFWRTAIVPQVTRIADAMSHWLAPAYGGAVRLMPDLDEVPALAIDREALWRRIGTATFLTDAEKRAALGWAD